MAIQICVPKEVRDGEQRVALVPDVVNRLANENLVVSIQSGAGELVGYTDKDYEKASIVDSSEELLGKADITLTQNDRIGDRGEVERGDPGGEVQRQKHRGAGDQPQLASGQGAQVGIGEDQRERRQYQGGDAKPECGNDNRVGLGDAHENRAVADADNGGGQDTYIKRGRMAAAGRSLVARALMLRRAQHEDLILSLSKDEVRLASA